MGDTLFTTGEAARRLGSSRQHVVDLCNKGLLPFTVVNRHRRIRAADLDAFAAGAHRMTRDQQRSLRLAYAVAAHLVMDPERTLNSARNYLHSLPPETARRRGAKWRQQWESLLDGPLDDLLTALTADTVESRELRQSTPFIGVLSDGERNAVLSHIPAPKKQPS